MEIPEVDAERKGGWEKIGENFSEVSISHDGQIWAIGSQVVNYAGCAIYYYHNGAWVQVPGEATRICAYKAGEVWAVN